VRRRHQPLHAALSRAGRTVFGAALQVCPNVGRAGVWRDINPYIEGGIPARQDRPGASAGPYGRPVTRVADLAAVARVYAATTGCLPSRLERWRLPASTPPAAWPRASRS
jgi:hypothetical protein